MPLAARQHHAVAFTTTDDRHKAVLHAQPASRHHVRYHTHATTRLCPAPIRGGQAYHEVEYAMEAMMERERAKAGDTVRPIGWHHRMLVIKTSTGHTGLSDDDDVLCRWIDDRGEHQQVFKSGQLEVITPGSRAHNPGMRTVL